MGFKHHVRHSPSSKEEVHVGYIPKAISGFKLPGVGSSGQKEGLMLDPKCCIVGEGAHPSHTRHCIGEEQVSPYVALTEE
jgi:hypothetical protein